MQLSEQAVPGLDPHFPLTNPSCYLRRESLALTEGVHTCICALRGGPRSGPISGEAVPCCVLPVTVLRAPSDRLSKVKANY